MPLSKHFSATNVARQQQNETCGIAGKVQKSNRTRARGDGTSGFRHADKADRLETRDE